jgi:hypothetical protein
LHKACCNKSGLIPCIPNKSKKNNRINKKDQLRGTLFANKPYNKTLLMRMKTLTADTHPNSAKMALSRQKKDSSKSTSEAAGLKDSSIC